MRLNLTISKSVLNLIVPFGTYKDLCDKNNTHHKNNIITSNNNNNDDCYDDDYNYSSSHYTLLNTTPVGLYNK